MEDAPMNILIQLQKETNDLLRKHIETQENANRSLLTIIGTVIGISHNLQNLQSDIRGMKQSG